MIMDRKMLALMLWDQLTAMENYVQQTKRELFHAEHSGELDEAAVRRIRYHLQGFENHYRSVEDGLRQLEG